MGVIYGLYVVIYGQYRDFGLSIYMVQCRVSMPGISNLL